jgi:hypothetical protein
MEQQTIFRELVGSHLLPLLDTTIDVSNCPCLVFDIDHQGRACARPLVGLREGGDSAP